MFTDTVVADWPIEANLTPEVKQRQAERLRGLLYRFGGEEVTCELSPDGGHVTSTFTFSAPSEEEAQGVVTTITSPVIRALRYDSYDYVDEYPWPEDEDLKDLPAVREEVERALHALRLRFSVYSMPTERGGIVVELHDHGGATPEESVALGRRIIDQVYGQAYERATGKPHRPRHHTIGGILGNDGDPAADS